MISGCITPAIMHEALRRTPNHKAAGPNGVHGMILKHMPTRFHEALQILFQAMPITGITPPSWLHSHIILLYKKGDPATLDNYRPITLANALYKLWTICIVMLATDYVESRKSSARNKKALEHSARAHEPLHTSVCASRTPTHTTRTLFYASYTSRGLSPQPTMTSWSEI
jgi:hypothetical protein